MSDYEDIYDDDYDDYDDYDDDEEYDEEDEEAGGSASSSRVNPFRTGGASGLPGPGKAGGSSSKPDTGKLRPTPFNRSSGTTSSYPRSGSGSSSSSSTPSRPKEQAAEDRARYFGGSGRTYGSSSSSSSSKPSSSGSSSSSSSTRSYGSSSSSSTRSYGSSYGGGSASRGKYGTSSGGGSDTKAQQDDDKKEDSGGSIGSRMSGLAGRLRGGGKDDAKDDKKGSTGGAVAGAAAAASGALSRFGRGGSKDDDKDGKKDEGGGIGSRVSGFAGRFRGGGKDDDKKGNAPAAKPGGIGSSSSRSSSAPTASKAATSSAATGAKRSFPGINRGKSAPGSAPAAPVSKEDKKDEGGGIGSRVSGFAGRFRGGNADAKPQKTSKTRASKVPHAKEDAGLSLDAKLDILGVGLVFAALVIFVGSLSSDPGQLVGGILSFFTGLVGWGAFAVPISMGAVGLWLIVRHFGEDAPEIDPVRVSGLIVLYFGLLLVFQIGETFREIYREVPLNQYMLFVENLSQGRGGGVIGANLHFIALQNVGEFGAYLIAFFILTVGAMLTTRTSAAEIAIFVISVYRSLQISMQRRAQKRAAERMAEQQRLAEQAAQQQAQISVSAPAAGELAAGQTSGALPAPDQNGQLPIEQRGIPIRMGGQMISLDQQQQQVNGQPPQQSPQGVPATADNASSSLLSKLRGAAAALPLPVGGNSSETSQPQSAPPAGIPGEQAPAQTGQPAQPQSAPPPGIPGEPPAAQTQPGVSPQQPAAANAQTAPAEPTADDLLQPAQSPVQSQSAQQTGQAQPDSSATSPAASTGEQPTAQEPETRQRRIDQLRSGQAAARAAGGLMGSLGAQMRDKQAETEDEADAESPATGGPARPRPFTPGQSNQPAASQAGTLQKPAQDANQMPNHRGGYTPPSSTASTPPKVSDPGESQAPAAKTPEQPIPAPVQQPKPAASQSEPVINQAPPVRPTPQQPTASGTKWRLPDYRTLLSSGSEQEFDRETLVQRARIIEETLQSFGAPGRVVEINTGPVITQFGIEPDYLTARGGKKSRVKVSAIAQLDKDLQLALGAKSIRVEAPVPGKGYVGIEVPNEEASLVSLRDVMESRQFTKIKSPLAIALGQSVDGAPVAADLTSMPHLLIAGTTGSGKSVCVNAIINSITLRNTPDQVKFIMVDPKRVELTGYNGIPHLVAPVVVELERIVGVLKWVTREMDERYKKFSDAAARNIEDYNEHRDPGVERMPYIVVIIDELADLMMLAPDETERVITRIAALARATGIHLVIATQRPSVDVVTGLIKANFPARIAFAVASGTDSRVILDQPGADRLLGKGDMLYMSGDSPAPLRLQGVFVSDMEINNVNRYWRTQRPEDAPQTPITQLVADEKPAEARPVMPKQEAFVQPSAQAAQSGQRAFWDADEDDLTDREKEAQNQEDELYEEAVELVRRLKKASVSLLQRRLRIGYTRAARLIDVMEAEGIVGPPTEGSKPRAVLPPKK